MSDQLATDIRGIVDDGAPPIMLAELASLPETRPRPRRRWPVLTAAAAAAALIIVATILLVRTASDDGGTVLTPAGRPAPSAPAPAPYAPSPTPLGAPLVEGPDPASTLLASWGQLHVGYVFVYADGRVIWNPNVRVVTDADGRVTGIPIDPVVGSGKIAHFWLTESGLKPGLNPEGEFRYREGELRYRIIERQLSAHGLDLVREGKIEVKHLLVQPGERWPAKIPRSPVDLTRWPVAIQLSLRPELWAEPTRVWEPSTWAITFGWPVEAVDATRALEQLPVSAQALLTGKQRTCNYSIGNAHWPFRPAEGEQECFELTAAEFAAFWHILDPNTSTTNRTTGAFGPIEVDGRPVTLNALDLPPRATASLGRLTSRLRSRRARRTADLLSVL